jgi:hypothetical protein
MLVAVVLCIRVALPPQPQRVTDAIDRLEYLKEQALRRHVRSSKSKEE